MSPEPIAHIAFVNGQTRPVYEAGSKQYVLNDAGVRVYGVWYIPPEADAPIVVHQGKTTQDRL